MTVCRPVRQPPPLPWTLRARRRLRRRHTRRGRSGTTGQIDSEQVRQVSPQLRAASADGAASAVWSETASPSSRTAVARRWLRPPLREASSRLPVPGSGSPSLKCGESLSCRWFGNKGETDPRLGPPRKGPGDRPRTRARRGVERLVALRSPLLIEVPRRFSRRAFPIELLPPFAAARRGRRRVPTGKVLGNRRRGVERRRTLRSDRPSACSSHPRTLPRADGRSNSSVGRGRVYPLAHDVDPASPAEPSSPASSPVRRAACRWAASSSRLFLERSWEQGGTRPGTHRVAAAGVPVRIPGRVNRAGALVQLPPALFQVVRNRRGQWARPRA